VVLVIFVFLVYTASKELGSPKTVYNHLMEVTSISRVCLDPVSHHGQACGPISGNYKGSFLTMLSSGGLIFGIINIVGNFGTVFVDNVSSFSVFIYSFVSFKIWDIRIYVLH
jgi:urea-proton symporter